MPRLTGRLAPLLLVLVLPAAFALAACGDNVPGNAVARVDDETIDKSTFDRWMRIAAASTQAQSAPAGARPPQVQIPQPPDFARCVAERKRSAPRPAQGQPRQSDADLRTQCRQEYEGLRDTVLQFLINERWVEGEAAERGVTIPDAEFNRFFAEQKRQSFPDERQYQQFLRTSGYSEADIKRQLRFRQLSEKLTEQIVKGKDRVTDEQVRRYYERNRQRFAQPERRDLRVILTRTRERANQARRALAGGASFSSVAKRFSTDPASKDNGGVLASVARGQQEPALDRAVFSAPKGRLTGPVQTQFGFYLFKVQKITPPSQQPLAQARTTIRGILASEGQQKALDAFVKDFQEEWRDKTVCQEGFVIGEQCRNGKRPATTSGQTAPPGAAPPQGGAPQQAPPQQVPPQQGGAPQQVPPPQGAPPPAPGE